MFKPFFSNTCGTWLAVVCTSSNNNQPTRHQIVEKDHHRYIVQFVNTNDLKVSYSLSLEFKANHIINNLQIPVISISNSSMHASFHINRRKEQSVLVSACYLCKAITEEVARKSSFNIYDARKNSSSKTNIIRESIPQLTLELYCLQKRNEINNELASELEDEIQSDVSDCDYPYQQYKATHLASLNVKSIGNQAKALIKENEKEDIELIQSEITYNKAYLDKYGNLANPIRSARISILTNFALYVCRISESETSGSRHVLPGNDGRYRSRDDLISTVRMPSNGTNQDQPECILSYQTLFSIDSIYSHHCWITLENSNLYLIEINKAGRIEVYRDDISINQMILESRHWLENGCAKRLCLSDKDKRVVCLQAMGNIIFVCTEQNLYTFHLDCTKTSEMYGSTVDCISLRRITLRNLFVDRIQNNLKILIILPQKIKTMLKDQYYLLLLTSNFDLFSLKFDLLFLKNEHNDDRTVSSYHHHLHTSSQQPQFALSKVSEFIKGDIVGFDVSLVKSLVIISTMNGNRLQFYSGTSYFDLLFIIYQQRQTITVKFVSVDTFGSTLLILYNNGRSLVLYGIRASTIGELLFQTELPEQASKAKLCSVGKRIALALSKDGVRSFEPILHRTGRNRESMLSEYECVDIDWFLDGCHLAIACKNGTCLIWNSIKGYIVFTHVEHSTPYCSLKIDHSADIRLYISCLQSKSVIQLDRYEKRNLNETFTNEKVLKSTRLSQLPGGEPTCICVEHKILAIGGQNGTISLYTLPFSEVYNNICKQTAFAYFDAFSTEIIYLAMNHFEIVACDGNGCLIGLKIPHTTYYTGSGAQRLTEPLSAWSEVAQIDSKTISECQRAIEVGSQAADLTSRNVQSAFEISKQETIHSGEKRCEIVVDRIIESDKQSNLVLTNARTLVNHNQRSIEFLSNMYREIVNFYQQALVERIAVYREQMQSLTRSDSKMSHSGSSIKSLTEQLSQSTVNLLGQQTRETMILQRNLANLANSLLMQTEVCEKAKQLVKDFVNDRLYRCNQFVNFKLRAQQRKIKLMEEKLNDKTQQLTDLKEELESSKSRCRKLATRFGREMEKIAGKQAVADNRRRVLKICEQTRLHSRLEHYDLRNSIQQAEQYLPFLSHCRVNLYDAHNKMLNRYQRATSLNDQKKNIISEAVLISEENQADMVSAEMMIHVILQEINDVYRNRQICQIETRIIIDDITMIFDVATGRKFGGEKSPEFGVLIGKMRAKYFDQLKEKTKVDDEFNRQINYYRMEQINHISKDIEKLNAQLSHESNVVERQRLIPLYIIASDANAKMKVQIAETRRLLEECLERVNRHQIDLFFQEVNNICQLSQLAEESRDVYELEMFIDLLSDAKKRIEHVLCLVKNCNDSFEYPQDMHFYGSSYKTNQTFSSIQH